MCLSHSHINYVPLPYNFVNNPTNHHTCFLLCFIRDGAIHRSVHMCNLRVVTRARSWHACSLGDADIGLEKHFGTLNGRTDGRTEGQTSTTPPGAPTQPATSEGAHAHARSLPRPRSPILFSRRCRSREIPSPPQWTEREREGGGKIRGSVAPFTPLVNGEG